MRVGMWLLVGLQVGLLGAGLTWGVIELVTAMQSDPMFWPIVLGWLADNSPYWQIVLVVGLLVAAAGSAWDWVQRAAKRESELQWQAELARRELVEQARRFPRGRRRWRR